MILIHICILIHILFHYGLSQDIEYSSLSYTLGSCHLSILYSLYVLVPNFESMFPQHHFPLGNCKSVSYAWKSILFYIYVHLCFILDSTYKWYHMVFVFLFLPSLSTLISMSVHVAENGIISFFLWLVIHCTYTPHFFFNVYFYLLGCTGS